LPTRSRDFPTCAEVKSGANLARLQNINWLLLLHGWFWLIEILQVKYLNNMIEQDHRFIKKLIHPMKGFKSFQSALACASTRDRATVHLRIVLPVWPSSPCLNPSARSHIHVICVRQYPVDRPRRIRRALLYRGWRPAPGSSPVSPSHPRELRLRPPKRGTASPTAASAGRGVRPLQKSRPHSISYDFSIMLSKPSQGPQPNPGRR
jgi:hypothetical protein